MASARKNDGKEKEERKAGRQKEKVKRGTEKDMDSKGNATTASDGDTRPLTAMTTRTREKEKPRAKASRKEVA